MSYLHTFNINPPTHTHIYTHLLLCKLFSLDNKYKTNPLSGPGTTLGWNGVGIPPSAGNVDPREVG